jgi:hypothetical protein
MKQREINTRALFWFENRIIRKGTWAALPKASKAVYPVIAGYCNQNGVAWPSQKTIGKYAGVSLKSVRAGVEGLRSLQGFGFWEYTTGMSIIKADGKKIKRYSKKYKMSLPQEFIKGVMFPFYRTVVESGTWGSLKPSAKALYPVMRYFSLFDMDMYRAIVGEYWDTSTDDEFKRVYRDRKFDMCEVRNAHLSKRAGIHRTGIYDALNNLTLKNLIEWDSEFEVWKVFLKGGPDNPIAR